MTKAGEVIRALMVVHLFETGLVAQEIRLVKNGGPSVCIRGSGSVLEAQAGST